MRRSAGAAPVTPVPAVAADGETAPSGQPGPGPDGAHARRRDRVVVVGLLLFAALLVVLHVRSYPQLSPVDELQHVDYMIKASRGELVRRGDHVGQDAMREQACRGVDGAAMSLPSCDSGRFDPAAFQEEGFNTAEIHPPPYYVVTGAVARSMLPLLGDRGLLVAGRLVGALWLMAGVAVVWFLLAAFGVRPSSRVAVVLLVVTAPAVLHGSSTVNNDATALVAGGGLLLAAVSWQRRSLPAWAVAAVAGAGVLFKLTNLVGAGVAAGYLLLQALAHRRAPDGRPQPGRDARAHLAMAAGIVAAVTVAGLTWVVLHEALATAPNLTNPISRRLHVDSLSLEQVLPAAGAGVTPLDGAHLAPFLGGVLVSTLMTAVRWLFIGSSFGVAASAEAGSGEEAVALSTMATVVLGGPFFVVVNYLSLDVFYAVPPRYMLSAVPAMAVALGLSMRKPWTSVAGVTLGVAAAVVTLGALT